MNILVVPDKFKDSLSAQEVVQAITKGIQKHDIKHKIHSIMASDGGDGFLDAIHQIYSNLDTVKTKTVNALGEPILSSYLFDNENNIAYIELAKSSGLASLKHFERDCKNTSTYGTGIQIKHAIKKGAKTIFIGLGGSATNDGGAGIAHALNIKFLNKKGKGIFPQGKTLIDIDKISIPELNFESVDFYAINDVNNWLLGTNGATYTYAKQKGASTLDLPELELGMKNLFDKTKNQLPKITDQAGFGAAGGTSFGLATFFNAEIISGIDFIFDKNNIDKSLINNQIDLIITGEGKIDDQTVNGKFIAGVTNKAKKYHIPVVGICGVCELQNYSINDLGLHSIYPIKTKNMSSKESFNNAAKLIEEKVFELLKTEIFI